MNKCVVSAIVLLGAGCARAPGDIGATPVAQEPYLQMQCPELSTLKIRKQIQLSALEREQLAAAQQDAAAMAVIHIPVASMSGRDKEKEIGRLKGEVQAINSVYRSGGCVG